MSGEHKKRRQQIIAATSLTLAVGLACGVVGANATETPEFGNINGTQQGRITVHKHQHQTGSPVATAKADGSIGIPSPGIVGVKFSLFPLKKDGQSLDLSKQDHWTHLDGLQSPTTCEAPTGFTLGDEIKAEPTGADGKAAFTDLDLTAYVLCEMEAPAEVVDRAQPVIVTVPHPFENGWLYDFHVYPKNAVGGIAKTIEPQDPNTGLGSEISFPVTVDIPTLENGKTLASFSINDTLDSRLKPTNTQSNTKVAANGNDVDGTFYDVTVNGQKIEVAFTDDGLSWLTQQTGSVTVIFTGTIQSIGDGTLNNQAFANVNGSNLESNRVQSNWGDLLIKKTDSSTNEVGLEGAKFEIFNAKNPYAASCDSIEVEGVPLKVEGKTEFISGPDGTIVIPGVFVSDSVNMPTNATQRCYVLKEIEAPAGFALPEGDSASRAVAVKIGETTPTSYDITIPNIQKPGFELPLTGSSGRILMATGTAALILMSVGLLFLRRRSSAQR